MRKCQPFFIGNNLQGAPHSEEWGSCKDARVFSIYFTPVGVAPTGVK